MKYPVSTSHDATVVPFDSTNPDPRLFLLAPYTIGVAYAVYHHDAILSHSPYLFTLKFCAGSSIHSNALVGPVTLGQIMLFDDIPPAPSKLTAANDCTTNPLKLRFP